MTHEKHQDQEYLNSLSLIELHFLSLLTRDSKIKKIIEFKKASHLITKKKKADTQEKNKKVIMIRSRF
ncbi:MAG: hypothetical protein ACTSXH_11450 [Promethearchaeota archaeon]